MKLIKQACVAVVLLCCNAASAAIISDFDKSEAFAQGWQVVYQGGYAQDFNYGAVLNGITAGAKVALASSSSNSASTFDLFAGTSLATLQTITARNATIFADDAYWYRNNYSIGFAPSATIAQNSADTVNSGFAGGHISDAQDGDRRLSWHSGTPNDVAWGWRSGLNTIIGNDTWQRYVLVQVSEPAEDVPEPATLALLGLGLAGLASARRRHPAKNA